MTLEELKARAEHLWTELQELRRLSGVDAKTKEWHDAQNEYEREKIYAEKKAEKEGQ